MKIRVKLHFTQLLDWDDPTTVKAFAKSLPVASLVAAVAFTELAGLGRLAGGFLALVVFVIVEMLTATLILGVVGSGARAALSIVAPSGSSTPPPNDYSYEKSLLVRGNVSEALAVLEARLAEHPDDPALWLFAAEAHAREARDPAGGERLFLRVREMPGASTAQDYAATNRLIDLYMGPLDDSARAIAELERLRQRHAGTTAAAHAEHALRQLLGSVAASEQAAG
jgi:hypothetical protein